MARNKTERLSANYLHEKLNIPYSYLRRVLGDLSKKGFISSTAGRSGGFMFSAEIKSIYLSDIIQATEGLESFDMCLMGFTECPFEGKCPMHSVWERSRSEILSALQNTSLADLLKE